MDGEKIGGMGGDGEVEGGRVEHRGWGVWIKDEQHKQFTITESEDDRKT
jgi:hypothetical protein